MLPEIMGQMSQVALNQSDILRRQRLQNARSRVQEDLDNGLLHEQEALDLLGQIGTQLEPIQMREQESLALAQQAQQTEFAQQNAQLSEANNFRQASLTQNLPNRIAELINPNTGFTEHYFVPDDGPPVPMFQMPQMQPDAMGGGPGEAQYFPLAAGFAPQTFPGSEAGGRAGGQAGSGSPSEVAARNPNSATQNQSSSRISGGQSDQPPANFRAEEVRSVINDVINSIPVGENGTRDLSGVRDMVRERLSLIREFAPEYSGRQPSELDRQYQQLRNQYQALQIAQAQQRLTALQQQNQPQQEVFMTADGYFAMRPAGSGHDVFAGLPERQRQVQSVLDAQDRYMQTGPHQQGQQTQRQGQQGQPGATSQQIQEAAQQPVWERRVWHGNWNEQSQGAFMRQHDEALQRGDSVMAGLITSTADLLSRYGTVDSMPDHARDEYAALGNRLRAIREQRERANNQRNQNLPIPADTSGENPGISGILPRELRTNLNSFNALFGGSPDYWGDDAR